MNKAILVVSFGTSHLDALAKGIAPIEDAIKKAYPDCDIHRAFTSPTIMRKLRAGGMKIYNCSDMIERLTAQGYSQIDIVPTHVIGGQEYEGVMQAANGCSVSEPLLDQPEDYAALAAIYNDIAQQCGRTLLLMGHGTEHAANESYRKLAGLLNENAYLACVEGEFDLEGIMPELQKLSEKQLLLMPLMIVAGDHAKNDLAGDASDSWKSMLMEAGFDVDVRLDGMGSMPVIQRMFVEKAGRIIEC